MVGYCTGYFVADRGYPPNASGRRPRKNRAASRIPAVIGAALALRRETFSRLVELQDPRLDALPVAGIEPDRSRQLMEDRIVAGGREGLQEVGRGAQGGGLLAKGSMGI